MKKCVPGSVLMNAKIDLFVLKNVSRTVADPFVIKDARRLWNVAPTIGVLGYVERIVLKSVKDVTKKN